METIFVVAALVGRAVTVVRADSNPVEMHRATDLALEMNGAAGPQLEYLRTFALPPQAFSYTLRLISEEDGYRLYRLTFPSPVETPWPENNVVPAELYLPRGSEGKVPAAIVLDIMDGSAILPRVVARGAAQNGLAALYMPMPYYNRRRPKDDGHKRALADDPARATEGIRQTVMDVRRAKAILASRPEVDASRLGITGISLGGIMAALAAGVDGEFHRVVPILSGGDLATIIFSAHETRKVRAAMEAKGMTRDDAAKVLASVEPLNFASRIGAGRCLMLNAANDEVIPKATTEALHEAIGGPQIVWVSTGHYSALTYFPMLQQKTVTFLREGK